MSVSRSFFALAAVGSVVLCGCRIDNKNGDNGNFKVATPFGGMQVKTNDAAVQSTIGLPEYPGATPVKKDKNSGSADINMSFGSFQLRVKAMSYRTTDTPDKVKEFYRSAMARYGTVIECRDNHPVGTPTHTTEGLTCDNDHENHITVDEDISSKFEFKAGSKQHQHIVAIEPENGGTKFGLVALDLPGHLSVGDRQESSQ